MNETVIYYPTPVEQAHSLYVVQQIFHLAPTMPLRISGRSAVPFLTQSGVSRITLRSIWTAADPQNIGTLTHLTQFQLLLRLVSMAQFGILEVDGTAESMRDAAQQSASMRLALPIFSSLVIPPHDDLLAMYGMFLIQYQMQTPDVLSVYPGVASVSSFGATNTISVDDAFSDLGPTENAPLPSLDEVIGSAQTTDGVSESDLKASVTASEGYKIPGEPTLDVNLAVTGDEEDEFGDFEAVPETHAPESISPSGAAPSSVPSQRSLIGVTPTQQESNDSLPSFGVASSLAYVTEIPESAHDQISQPIASQSFDGSIQSFHADPGQAHGSHFVTQQLGPGQDDVGEFGPAQDQFGHPGLGKDAFGNNSAPSQIGFIPYDHIIMSPSFDGRVQSSSNSIPTQGLMVHERTAGTTGSVTDAFGAIGVEDAPLPSLDQLGVGDVSRGNSNDVDNDDNFGGFETSIAPSNQSNNIFLNPSPEATTQPLPCREVSDFSSGSMLAPAYNNIAGLEMAPIPPFNESVGLSVASDVDYFSSFGQAAELKDVFDHTGALVEGASIATAPASKDDPFGSIPTNDAPLSTPGPFTNEIIAPSTHDEDDEEFGGFEEAPIAQEIGCIQSNKTSGELFVDKSSSAHPAVSDDDDEFKNCHGASLDQRQRDTVVPVIPSALSIDYASSQSGAKELNTLSQEMGFLSGGLDDSDPFAAFDTIAPIAQPELPPLSVTRSLGGDIWADVPNEGLEDEDDFGDFASSNPLTEEHSAELANVEEKADNDGSVASLSDAKNSSDNTFMAFDSAPSKPAQKSIDEFHSVPSQSQRSFAITDDSLPALVNAEDNFGDAAVSATPEADLFGSFDGVTIRPVDTDDDLKNDFFGAIDSLPAHPTPSASSDALLSPLGEALPQSMVDSHTPGHDDFGAFDAPTSLSSVLPSILNDDLFGNHDSNDYKAATAPAASHPKDSFGAFDAFSQVAVSHNDDEDWGDFDGAPKSQPVENFVKQPVPSLETDDDWGDFDTAPVQADGMETLNDDLGTFGAFAEVPTPSGTRDDDLGGLDGARVFSGGTTSAGTQPQESFNDFVGSSDQTSMMNMPQVDHDAFDDDWGDFENVEAPSFPETDFKSLQKQIRDLSMPLTENILRTTGLSGGHVDLGECFEVHIGLHPPMDLKKKQRMERAIQILEILSKMNHNYGSLYWEQVIKVVRDELANGHIVMKEARTLSASELAGVSHALVSMVVGLAEFVRVERSIVATIGDMLMLDPNALLTVDTMASTWCSLSILEMVLEIELEWKNLLSEFHSLIPSSEAIDAPALDEIRSDVLEWFPNDNLCELTLQPLLSQNESTTKAQVSWKGGKLMACSGNLLANRCPFYVARK